MYNGVTGNSSAKQQKGGRGKHVASIYAVFAKKKNVTKTCLLMDKLSDLNYLVLRKSNDTLLKIIDWMLGWMGCHCPPVRRSGCSSSRELNAIKLTGCDSQLFSQEFPHTILTNHSYSNETQHLFWTQPNLNPLLHKNKRGALLLQQRSKHGRTNTLVALMQSCYFWV